ncbi:hypothetical protein [Rubritalea tangerina]|uniref:hypothetical protein n=1 Tax=Rubritalea tangerina TaxID=430798 RepID=UPI0036239F9E
MKSGGGSYRNLAHRQVKPTHFSFFLQALIKNTRITYWHTGIEEKSQTQLI